MAGAQIDRKPKVYRGKLRLFVAISSDFGIGPPETERVATASLVQKLLLTWRATPIMRSMSLTAIEEILNAAEHMPADATLIVHEISWEDFERVVDGLEEEGVHRRVCYDSGRLELVSPSNRHEIHVRFFDRLVSEFARIRKIPVEMLGQTLWKKRALAKGIEADCCYFITNATFVAENYGFDVETGPPPDIAVEIDITSNSLRKLSIYAALLVSEVWRYDGKAVRIFELRESKYVEIDGSRFLPDLTAALLNEFVELCKLHGQTKALAAFGRRIRKHE
jgi:Uma2 family endonuclease